MASVFTKIIRGELPGPFVWKDETAIALLTRNPIKPGHTLVVPRREVDHWLDLEPALAEHLTRVAQGVGRARPQAHRHGRRRAEDPRRAARARAHASRRMSRRRHAAP